jgi:hypothetical protein
MWRVWLLCSLVSWGCCPHEPEAVELPLPAGMPEEVYFRTRTETFNQDHYLVLRGGRLWHKANRETTGKETAWRQLGKTGLPEGCGLSKFGPPKRVVSLSGDGVHLQALGDNDVIYRATNLRHDISEGMEWNDAWGWPLAIGPGLKSEWGEKTIWDVSDAHLFDLKYYEDGNGTRHHIGLGVAHVYILDPDGKRIYYNDWWLPADWSRQLCGPLRGTFQAIQLSASGSTLFVINEHGEMYTHLYDFDVAGENPFLTYSFVAKDPPANVRRIPMPGWRKQPPITAGRITSKITIFQDGEGNEARTLRVEGEKEGATGFFYKKIFAETWEFKETNHLIELPFLTPRMEHPATEPPRNPEDTRYQGTLTREYDGAKIEIVLRDFHMVCSPAQAELWRDGKAILGRNGRPFTMAFHHVHTMVTQIRKRDYWKQGERAQIRAALIPPDSWDDIADESARSEVKSFFMDLKVINFGGEASIKEMKLHELTKADLFRVPDDEKGDTSRFTLWVKAQ